MYSRSTEIRHIAAIDVYRLAQILEQSNSWKKLMETIPKSLDPESWDGPKKYNKDDIQLIEIACIKQNRMAMEILFEEWGTSGRKRATVENLRDLLVQAELFRAADFVAENFLNELPPKRPTTGPAARIDISLPFETEEIQQVEGMLNEISYPGSTNLIENANQSSNMNNKDFYSKFIPDRPKIEISASDLMKFSTSTINTNEIPTISTLIESTRQNTQISKSNSANGHDESGMSEIESYIPALSELQINCSDVDLPNLSVLNLDVMTISPQASDDDSKNLLIASSTSFDDSNLTPDLSILDQSSLDYSSLTNVTETSEDLSFDSKTRLNLSENNIPMLSILQK